MDAYAQSNQQGFRMYQPKPINPIIQYVSEKVAAPVEQTSDEAIIERAKMTGKPAHAQAYEDYAKNQAQIDFLRQESEANAARALGFQSPEVDRIYGEIATNQANAPEPPSMMTPQAPNIAQRGMAVLASLINPRLGLTLQNQPMLVNEQLAKEQDQRNVADYTRADTRFSKMMTALNTRLGIAQRDETAQRNTAASIANRQQSEATRLSGQSGTMLSKLMASIDNEANRLSRESIANQKIEFETDKATNKLKFEEQKLGKWVEDRAAQLAETIRYHTGMLDVRDKELAISQAKMEAANLMDAYKVKWGEETSRQKAGAYSKKFRDEATKEIGKENQNLFALQEKKAKIVSGMKLLNDQLILEKNDKKREELMSQIAALKGIDTLYGSQIAVVQNQLLKLQMEGGGGGYEGTPVFDPAAGAGQIDPNLAMQNQTVPPGQAQQSTYNGIGPGPDGKPLGPGTKIGDGSGNLPTGGADRRPKFPKASAGSVSGKGGNIGYTPVKGK
jgi:hypothetical protein